MNILTINARLSSIKLKIFRYHNKNKINLLVSAHIHLDKAPSLTISTESNQDTEKIELNGDNQHLNAIDKIFQNPKFNRYTIDCTINKIAYGGEDYVNIILLHIKTLNSLSKHNDLLPNIQPYNILVAKYFLTHFPKMKHYATFDNGFHHTIPKINQALTLSGLKGYGVHGLSSEYIADKLSSLVDDKLARANWVIVHLGVTSSICGIKKGKSFVTESIKESNRVLVSIADGVEIPEKEYDGLVIESYALSVARSISLATTSLGGINGIVFTGNISQNSPQIRKLILDKLSWLGAIINKKANNNQKLKISDKDSKITVLLVSTNEGYAMVNQFVEDKL